MIKKILYAIWLVLFCVFLFMFIKDTNFHNFLVMIENRTFDMRQSIAVSQGVKNHNDNIVIIAIDDASYEYILENYGEWPIPRDLYSKLATYIEQFNPQSIVFDLMFVKSLNSSTQADEQLVNLVKKYPNVFVAMNFDNQEESLRKSPDLPKNLALQVNNNSEKVDFSKNSYSNCRKIIDGLINSTKNIGLTNVSRSDDGILRKMPVLLQYKGNLYPQLGFRVGLDYLNKVKNADTENLQIDEHSNLIIGGKKYFLDDDGSLILNWYGPNETYQYIPLYKLIQLADGKVSDLDIDFNGKIVLFGTTAASLFDIKSVPVSKNYPGVEVQATYINNIIDGTSIIKLDKPITAAISVLLSIITILIVLCENSAIVGALATLTIYLVYVFLTYFVMRYFNIWLEIIYPFLIALSTFVAAYIIKYLIKSKDFEQQYKLATTDGLTELYNHRYFQEQMKQMVDSSERYETQFSLIILDIDFFKKFNDTFGHQAGDSILRQVALTLKRNVRASDIVCRYGGEEMSIILANTDNETAMSTAQKICNRISQKPFRLPNGKDASVTISLGVSTYPHDGTTPSELIDAADKHLYNAKNSGRNKVGT